MEKQTGVKRAISARKHIREFAAAYSEKCGRTPAYIERDILSAKKSTIFHSVNTNGQATVSCPMRRSAVSPHCGRAPSSERLIQTGDISVC